MARNYRGRYFNSTVKASEFQEPHEGLMPSDKILFGKKHKGKSIQQVLTEDPQYLLWAEENISWFRLCEEVRKWAKEATK